MTTLTYPNSPALARERAAAGRVTWAKTLGMLTSRTVLFALFQALFGLVLALAGAENPWAASVAWWPFSALLTNLVSVYLLDRLARQEGLRLVDLYRGRPAPFRTEVLIAMGLFLVAGPVAQLPNTWLATLLFGDSLTATRMMFRPLPIWAAMTGGILFPLTIAFAELPTYMGYALSHVEALTGKRWLAVLLAGVFLAVQHVTLPLIFDARFILWRLLMFLPFALFVAVLMRWRPQILPYFMVGHALIDLSLAPVFLMSAQGTL